MLVGAMKLRFYIDPETSLPHIYNHDVREEEIEEALLRPGEDRPARDGSRIALGQTQGGRFLRVIYVVDPSRRVCASSWRMIRPESHWWHIAVDSGGERNEKARFSRRMGREADTGSPRSL